LDVIGITCVSGNVAVEQVVANTNAILDALDDADTPVVAGAVRPLLGLPHHATGVHGADGLGDLGLNSPAQRPTSDHAVTWLRDTLQRASAPVTVLGLGPATNLALLLVQYPQVAQHIERIVLMAGCVGVAGNAGPVAEFNVRADPEALSLVLSSGVPVTLYTLDVFRPVRLSMAKIGQLQASTDRAANLAGQILARSLMLFGGETAAIGDAGLVSAFLAPDCLHTERLPVAVELSGQHTRGQTVVDRRSRIVAEMNSHWGQFCEPNADVATVVDGEALAGLFFQTILAPSARV
jgi:pyrimidine-specific ribonucleoside hydrolase